VLVKDLVKHILHHVDAEDAERDPSQVEGVAARAQYVRDTVDGFKTDARDVAVDKALGEFSTAASLSAVQASFKNSITNMLGEPRPQLAIQTWVGKAREQRGG
jgi:hypothetical protein